MGRSAVACQRQVYPGLNGRRVMPHSMAETSAEGVRLRVFSASAAWFWRQRTNVWRRVTSPAKGTQRLKKRSRLLEGKHGRNELETERRCAAFDSGHDPYRLRDQ
jgi:hypothetical protein